MNPWTDPSCPAGLATRTPNPLLPSGAPSDRNGGSADWAGRADRCEGPAGIELQACARLIGQARRRRRKIDRAVALAGFNGWTLAVLAGLSVACAPFTLAGALAAVVLGSASAIEFRGRRLLRQLDDRAPWLLAANQAALGVLVAAYGLWRLWQVRHGMDGELAALRQLGASGAGIADMAQAIQQMVYLTVVAAVLVIQSMVVGFYLSRRAALRRFRRQTPPWILNLLEQAG